MNLSFRKLFEGDMKRYGFCPEKYERKFHYHFRKCQTTNNTILLLYHRYMYKRIREARGVEIPYSTQIEEGLYLGHTCMVHVNEGVKIGRNVNLHKGVTIGQENRGKRKGVPTIGNNVWIGVNAVVVGNVKIGDDVLIAPNSFVNCDVPSHSVVVGNPCVIKHKDFATADYINNTV